LHQDHAASAVMAAAKRRVLVRPAFLRTLRQTS
jgi:hypothetical protein